MTTPPLSNTDTLITNLHTFLRWASTLDKYVTVSDPTVADGLDFTFWADECAKHLGLMNAGQDVVTGTAITEQSAAK